MRKNKNNLSNTFLKLFFFTVFLLMTGSLYGQNLTIQRKIQGDECTQGYLLLDNMVMCYTLERDDYANAKNASCILPGTYDAFIRTDKAIGWRIELVNVPGRDNIQLHVGNYPFQTIGCVLLGTGANTDNCTLSGSKDALAKLRHLLNNIQPDLDLDSDGTKQYSIKVTIQGI